MAGNCAVADQFNRQDQVSPDDFGVQGQQDLQICGPVTVRVAKQFHNVERAFKA